MITMRVSMICGNCGVKCQSVHTVGWTNKAVCEKCQLGRMYKFVSFVKNNHLPYGIRRIIAIVTAPLFIGFNTCSHCGLTPPFGRHSVDCEGWGASLLCTACFKELSLEIKLNYHRQHCLKYDVPIEQWNELREAAIRDHRLIPFGEYINESLMHR